MNMQQIAVLGAVVVLVGGGVWFMTSKPAQAPATNVTETTQRDTGEAVATSETTNEPVTGFGSFADLLGLGKNLTCTYSYSDESGNGSGVGYFAGERMRVDSEMTTDGMTFDSSLINDGEFVYTWSTGGDGAFAMKMPVPDETTVDSLAEYDGPETGEQSQVSVDQEVEYDCDRWVVDTSVFVPPSDIEFMDMAAMMQEALQGLPEGFELPEGFTMP